MWIGRRHAAPDVCLGLIAGILDLLDGGSHPSWLTATGGRNLTSVGQNSGVKRQVGQNYFPPSSDAAPEYFFLVSGERGGKLYV